MILTETLFPHLWEIDETAHRRVEQIMPELLEKNPAPDKSTQQLAWVQHMSSLKVQCNNTDNNYTDYSYYFCPTTIRSTPKVESIL